MDSVFENNVLLTQTERLMMSGRPKEPKYARNKTILVIGGSGSGKTCGSKMSYQTNYYKSGEPYHSFRCSSYGNRTVNCTIHHISDKVLYDGFG
jgi:phage terminase large subunit-like protein